MTDRQQELLQKMMEGEITPWLDTYNIIFQDLTNGGLSYLVTEHSSDWADYDAAWREYKKIPLIEALE